MVGHLLLKRRLVLLEESPDRGQPRLFLVEIGLKLVSPGELVRHLVLHLGDLLRDLLHLLVNSALEGLDLV
jgi:hypothetical protein